MRGLEVLARGVNLGSKDSILSHLDHELMLSLFPIYDLSYILQVHM